MANLKAIMGFESINFLDTTPKTEAHTWALMNKGIESGAVAYNAETDERHYIADKNATATVKAFARALDITQYAYKGDATFEYIDDLFYKEAIGGDAQTNLLQVFLYKAEDKTTAIPAKLTPVTVELGEHGVEGGEQLALSYNILFTGDSTNGTVTITEGVPVFTPDTPIV